MHPRFSSIFIGLFVAVISAAIQPLSPAKTLLPEGSDQSKEQEDKRATLSELGIDFGAAELGRYAELDLTGKQKRAAVGVVKGHKPRIEKLADRMTKALALGETTLEKKRIKETELETILVQFKEIQTEIIEGLHALVTKEQMAKLETMKEQERKKSEKERSSKSGA